MPQQGLQEQAHRVQQERLHWDRAHQELAAIRVMELVDIVLPWEVPVRRWAVVARTVAAGRTMAAMSTRPASMSASVRPKCAWLMA
ncbi:hypothetical protein BGE01nite_20430 [Brevifollis gellanilyticus]|uniref:Uncharacterized protein n=1 Tax=Brevifollis gellanilyticus TaxID=748831 RepID=A0A512M7N7_9BACT|nr:hypothetical protein BGE01nite_20430 [Brevifollis gellanilyticus]